MRVFREVISRAFSPIRYKNYRIRRLLGRAVDEFDAKRVDESLRHVLRALALDPMNEQALEHMHKIYASKGDYRSSINRLQSVVAAYPRHVTAYTLLGTAYRKNRMFEAAAASFERALALHDRDHRVWNELGIVNLERGQTAAARSNFQRALEIAPDLAEAHCNLGIVALDEKQFERAAAFLGRATALDPELTEAYVNLGLALYGAGRTGDAERVIIETLARDPNNQLAKLYSSFLLLARGEWRAGWEQFEARLAVDKPPASFRYPTWNGESLRGKRILIFGEQGLGDEIMFASCLPDMVARGPKCTLVSDSRLKKLFQRSFPMVEVRPNQSADNAGADDFDYQVASGSLPKYFRNHDGDFPLRSAYLQADAGYLHFWKGRLDALGPGLKIGISWRGGTLGTRRALRSVPLIDLLPPLCEPNVHFINLQYGDSSDELKELQVLRGKTLHHWPEAITDYDQTAALVCALDLVISVCTSVVHLAGALGQKTWVLVPSSPEWRYGFAGDTMPWYPSVRLFRQPALGEWQPVIDAVAARLGEYVASRRTENGDRT